MGLLVAPVLGVVALLNAFQMRLMSFRTILIAAIYMYAIFWISAGAAMYVGALFLELLGHPVGF